MFKIFNTPMLNRPSDVSFYDNDGLKYLKRIPVAAGDKTVYLNAMPDDGSGSSVTYLTTKYHQVLGFHDYSMFPDLDLFVGEYIEVSNKSNYKKGYGETLRLASIIEMRENNLKRMSISAVPNAVLFHKKYRFFSDLHELSDIKKIMRDINSKPEIDKSCSSKAGEFLDLIEKNNVTAQDQNILREINQLVDRYINSNKLRWDKAKFRFRLPMSLTETVLKSNADFYNNLFKKHKINYKI